MSKDADRVVQQAADDLFNKKMDEYAARAYTMKNSWDEEDYKAKLKKYKETGELPEKLF